MKPQCDTCRYWQKQRPNEGLCRRHTPMALVVDGYPTTGWPSACSWEWCGEYEPAEGELPTQLPGGE